MDEKFKKIKNKCLIEALIKSAVIGISAGLFVTGIILLSLVLTGNSIHWAIYIPIGLISALAGGGVSFLFMRPSDMRVAKKYDGRFFGAGGGYNRSAKKRRFRNACFSARAQNTVQSDMAVLSVRRARARAVLFGGVYSRVGAGGG